MFTEKEALTGKLPVNSIMENTVRIQTELAAYFAEKLAEHGPVPQGVDWNGAESQKARFEQLAGVIQRPGGFTINDLGCGYGALFAYLRLRYRDFMYNGYDVSEPMIRAAKGRYAGIPNAYFDVATEPAVQADYGIASGIFNVKFGYSDAEWSRYVTDTLDVMDRTSRCGFAFNCLTSYSDPEKMRSDLYYADPCVLFDLCKRRYSRKVAVLHDYELYDFTIIVRKQP